MHAKPHIMKRLAFVLAASLAVVVLAAPSVARADDDGEQDTVTLDSYEGAYLYSGGKRQREAIDAEIDAATEDLGPMLRGLARKKIKKSQIPSASLFIKVDGETVKIIRSGDQPTFEGKANGDSFVVKRKYKGTIKFRGGKLSVTIKDKDSKTTIVYRLNEDTGRVTVSTKIEHGLLPRPVKVKKTYKRAD